MYIYLFLFYLIEFFSLAASLLPSASAGVAVGFGGYVGSSRLESTLSSEESSPYLVNHSVFSSPLLCKFYIIASFYIMIFFNAYTVTVIAPKQ